MRLSIPRLTNLSAAFTVLAILSAAFSVYIFGTSLGSGSQQQRTDMAARLASSRVEAVIEQHREIARRLATRVAEEGLLGETKGAARGALGATLAPALPQVMKLRLIPVGARETDASSVPELSFACLDLIARSEKNEPVPNAELHMPGTPSAHIDVLAPVPGPPDKPAAVGHVLLSLNPGAIRDALATLQATDGYAELLQAVSGSNSLLVASGGDSSLKSGPATVNRTIANTGWQLAVWPAPPASTPSATELAVSGGAALLALALFILSAVLPRRALAAAVQHDAEVLQTLFQDIRNGVLMGQYPFQLREFTMLAKRLRASGEEMIQDRRQLEKMAQHDSLTGLASQTIFEQRLEKLLQQARLGFSSAILITDIDNLDQINTQLGPEAGEFLLKQFARQLREILRQTDTVARLDNGMFGVLFPFTDLDKIMPVVERLRGRMANEFDPGTGMPRAYSWSAGLTLFSTTDLDATASIQRAEAALATARREGGNRTVTHMP